MISVIEIGVLWRVVGKSLNIISPPYSKLDICFLCEKHHSPGIKNHEAIA